MTADVDRRAPRLMPAKERLGWVAMRDLVACTGPGEQAEQDLVVLILARNEGGVLENTLSNLVPCLGDPACIHVVVDHCVDSTASIARKAGVTLHLRSHGRMQGKGAAMDWWVQRTKGTMPADQIIIVLDADSVVSDGYFERVRWRFFQGAEALQTIVSPRVRSGSPISRMAALSEIVDQRVNDKIRARLGWSVRLRGTGMAFRRHILESFSPLLRTTTEDIELSLLLARHGVRVFHEEDVFVWDPKPEHAQPAIRQRARWLRGQYQVLRSYPAEIVRIALSGWGGLTLLGSLLLRPRSLIFPFQMLAALIGLLVGLREGMNALWLLASSLAALPLAFYAFSLLYGLRFIPDRGATLWALAKAPVYILLWIRTVALALVTDSDWLRSRPIVMDSIPNEP